MPQPLVLPSIRGGLFRDDFRKSGMINPLYTVSTTGQIRTHSADGVDLQAPGSSTTAGMDLNSAFRGPNVDIEVAFVRLAGSTGRAFSFRRLDANNRWEVNVSSTTITLAKRVAGVLTQYATTASSIGADVTVPNVYRVQAVADHIRFWMNGLLLVERDDADNINNEIVRIGEVFDSVAGVAKGRWLWMQGRILGQAEVS